MKLTRCKGYGYNKGAKCNFTSDNFNTMYYKPTATAKRGDLVKTYAATYVLTDGREMFFTLEYIPNFAGFALSIVVDVNGKRGRTVMGQDIFVFSLCNFRGITNRLKVGPAASWSETHSSEYLTENCIKTIPYVLSQGSACGHLLERNGWKFPKNYPIKF